MIFCIILKFMEFKPHSVIILVTPPFGRIAIRYNEDYKGHCPMKNLDIRILLQPLLYNTGNQ